MMKILYLTQYAIDGQFQSQFYNYAKDVDDHFDVEVAYLFPFEPTNSLILGYRKNGVKVSSLNYRGGRISFKNFFKYVKFLKERRIDIVHSQHPIAGFYNKLGTRFVNLFYGRKIKIIVEQRCVKRNLSFFARVLETLTHPLANLVLCSSDSVEQSYFAHVNYHSDYLAGKRINHFTFYNSINTASFEATAEKQLSSLQTKELVKICIVGRNEPVKQPLLVIQAIEQLKRKFGHVKLYLAGTGSLNDELEAYVKTHGLENEVEFLGNIDYVPRLLSECDIYINYSKHEGLCKSLLESMAAGTPVIASRVEGNIEVVGKNNEYGILVEDRSPEKLADAILLLISDHQLYLNYSKLGKERVKTFDTKFQIKEVELIYNKIKDEA